jgi:hypothetical protein
VGVDWREMEMFHAASRSWTPLHLFGDKQYRTQLIKTKKRFDRLRTIIRSLANEARSSPISDAACSGTCAVSDLHCICLNVSGQSSFRIGSSSIVQYPRSSEFLDDETDEIALEDCDLSTPDKANTPTRRILWDGCLGYDCRR